MFSPTLKKGSAELLILSLLEGRAGMSVRPNPIPDTPEARTVKPWDWEWVEAQIGQDLADGLREDDTFVEVEEKEWDGRLWKEFCSQFLLNRVKICKALNCNSRKLKVVIDRGYHIIRYN